MMCIVDIVCVCVGVCLLGFHEIGVPTSAGRRVVQTESELPSSSPAPRSPSGRVLSQLNRKMGNGAAL